ncbi:MAG TPA: hypothetical protein DCM62_03450 [Bacteroidales bacterium]|nr:hypothetical protein [Bacteroidales bacterium]
MRIIESSDNTSRLEANKVFTEALQLELLADNLFLKDFSLARTFSVLQNPDKTFRIVTWYVPFTNGTFLYFGFVVTRDNENKSVKITALNDQTPQLQQPEGSVLDANNWYGAFYYELVHVKYRRANHYVLLGWKGYDRNSRKRVIEPLTIVDKKPVFGDAVFEMQGSTPYRIIFEYSARASMGLNFYPEFAHGRRQRAPTIVFDRLVAMQSDLEGNFSFYVPEVNIFDAFRFYQGRWILEQDVDARAFINPALRPLNPAN